MIDAQNTAVEALALVILNSDREMAGLPPVASRDTIPDSEGYVVNAEAVLAALPASIGGTALPMTPEEHRLEDLKQMAAYAGPNVSFDVREPHYLASCNHCGWVGSSELCGTDSWGDDSDVYCPRCQTSGADGGEVADRIACASDQKKLQAELEHLRAEIDTPLTGDFVRGANLEAAHQRARWGADHDAGKSPFDWFWLIGYLAQKAADAAVRGDREKALHHTISTGAALANWHLALSGLDQSMRPGIESPAAEVGA